MKQIGIFLLLLCSPVLLFPCGNSYRRNTHTTDYLKDNQLESFRFRKGFDQSVLLQEFYKLTDAISNELNLFENKNDKALAWLRMGKTQEAIAMLEQLEKEKPNEYKVIANLGTAYELAGRNKEALQYIRRAMQLNSQSHQGSEWFHVQVLEAKLQQKPADWWISHPVLRFNQMQKDTETIISDIVYQLKERLPFTPVPDLMMAAILRDAAGYLSENRKWQQEWVLLRIATEYDSSKKLKLDDRIQTVEAKLKAENLPLPDYATHFGNADDLLKKGKDLLERGIEFVNGEKEKPAEKATGSGKANYLWVVILTGVLLAGTGLYFGFRKK
jgi:tetratricopeptide (TPR) repeat protein